MREQTSAHDKREARRGVEIQPLSARETVGIAWRSLKIRFWRSMVVVSGIVLAIAFLTYILVSDAFSRHVVERGSVELVDALTQAGVITEGDHTDQRTQTLWMVGLALLISFVGIVNAMLMSVTERFREIGTMKCLGALDSFVLQLFLVESVFQGTAGTFLGLLLGLVLGFGEGLTTYGGEVWHLMPGASFWQIAGGCMCAGVLLTVLGALYPAYRAARMSPVMALRSEV